MNPEEKSRIEGLNDTLYSRTRYRDPLGRRNPVKELKDEEGGSQVGEKWQSPELDEMLKHERAAPTAHPVVKKIFIFALIFFVATLGAAWFVLRGGSTFVSSKNVDINIVGPSTVSAGDSIELAVTISNTNNADLEVANLSIQYPTGSKSADSGGTTLTYTRENLGAIKAGAEAIRNTRLILLGSMGEVKDIKFSVDYKVKGSNATFHKDKIFTITIGEAPLALVVSSPSSIVSGENLTTSVKVVSEATETLKNVVLKAEYPYGYTLVDATPNALDGNLWVLGDLAPGDEKIITIRGNLVGEDQEERTLRFYVGVSDGEGPNQNPRIIITSTLNTVRIDRQSLGLSILFNGENIPNYVAPAERPVSLTIRFENNFTDRLLAPRLEAVLTGPGLDKDSVQTDGTGGYDEGSSRATWNLKNSLGNEELAPGEGGQVSLSFASLPAESLAANKDINLRFTITAVPVGAVGQERVSATETRVVKISSQVNLSSRVLRTLGSYVNHGPIPPKVGEESSYTVVWNVGNTQGDLEDVRVSAQLAPSVKWVNAETFAGEKAVYNAATNSITWELDELASGAGFSTPAREVSFQVALTPTLGQAGTVPALVTGIVLTGHDTVSGNTITATNPPLTTRLSSDPSFIQGDDVVVR